MARLTQVALVLALAVVVARATILESVRDTVMVTPGSESPIYGAGPASSLALDLVACLPAILVLLRRALDRDFDLRMGWSYWPLGALAVWAMSSIGWAGDKYAAMVSAANWLGAMALLWAVAQSVRQWSQVRLVGAVCMGLMAVMIFHGTMYKLQNADELQQYWKEHRPEILRQRNIEPGSFMERQFENYIKNETLLGFSISPNSHAALLVLLGAVTLGLSVQRWKDGDGLFWAGVPMVLLIGAGAVGYFTRSRTAGLTAVFAVVMMCLLNWGRVGQWLAERRKRAYWIGFATVAGIIAIGTGVGLGTGGLVERSLTFRWHYWVGAVKMFLSHPLTGVGFGTFGEHYLAYRLPVAPEEVKDPHNFLLHMLAELGVVGGLLLLVWMGRMWWEMTSEARGQESEVRMKGDTELSQEAAIGLPLGVAIIGIALGAIAAIDWNLNQIYELFLRGIYLLLLFIVTLMGSVRPAKHPEADDRPAPFVLYGMLIGFGGFLLHNLIDFSLFETGTMYCFAMLAGCALGCKRIGENSQSNRRWTGWVYVTGAAVIWLAAVGVMLVPTVNAEQLARRADEEIRAGNLREGVNNLLRAYDQQPFNGEYAYRAAKVMEMDRAPAVDIEHAYREAIKADPYDMKYHGELANFELSCGNVLEAMTEYLNALKLNPNNIQLHLQFGDVLMRLGRKAEAMKQYEEALRYNDLLPKDEIRRLPQKQVDEIREKVKIKT